MGLRDKVTPWRDRAPKENPNARCCWVCGRLGGDGFTQLLKWAGYRDVVSPSHAHPKCITKALKDKPVGRK